MSSPSSYDAGHFSMIAEDRLYDPEEERRVAAALRRSRWQKASFALGALFIAAGAAAFVTVVYRHPIRLSGNAPTTEAQPTAPPAQGAGRITGPMPPLQAAPAPATPAIEAAKVQERVGGAAAPATPERTTRLTPLNENDPARGPSSPSLTADGIRRIPLANRPNEAEALPVAPANSQPNAIVGSAPITMPAAPMPRPRPADAP